MCKIINYLDITAENKNDLLRQLLLTFGYNPNGREDFHKELEKSKIGRLPQYLLAYRDTELVGYLFIIGEKSNASKLFPYWAVTNADEIPLKACVQLLEQGIQICKENNCTVLSERLKIQLESNRKRLGIKTDCDCR